MHINSGQPRRLRVSSLAAVANPSYTRIDTWNLLDDACHHLATSCTGPGWTPGRRSPGRSGCWIVWAPTSGTGCTRARRIWRRSAAISPIWQRSDSPTRCRWRCACSPSMATAPHCSTWLAPLADQELVARAKQQQFYTVLLADDSPASAPESLAESLRALRTPSDDVQFELLVVSSVEDAITAVALNGEIQAAIIRHDLPLRSRDRLPLMTTLLGAKSLPVARRTSRTTGSNAASGSGSCARTSTCTCSPTNRSPR